MGPQDLKVNKKLRSDLALDQFLTDVQQSWWPSNVVQDFPTLKAKEAETCQRMVNCVIAELHNYRAHRKKKKVQDMLQTIRQ